MKTPENNNVTTEEAKVFEQMGMTREEGEAWMEASGTAWQDDEYSKLEKALADIGITVSQAQDWLAAKAPKGLFDAPARFKSFVRFVPARETKDVKLFVGDIEVQGITRASLTYTGEGFQTLSVDFTGITVDC